MRLDKLMEKHGCGGRNQVKKLLNSRQVSVDGQIVTQANRIVDSGLQEIKVADKDLTDFVGSYYILNKPRGVVTARQDENHHTVIDCISPSDRRDGLYPVGRLDRDTEGLVFLTTNGPIGFRLLHPRHHVKKTYYVEVNGYLGLDAPDFFASGVRFLDGTKCQPAKLTRLESGEEFSSAEIQLSEGKFHQVKKMFLAYGVKVTYLKRTSFGPFELGHLESGAYRSLTDDEKIALKGYFKN